MFFCWLVDVSWYLLLLVGAFERIYKKHHLDYFVLCCSKSKFLCPKLVRQTGECRGEGSLICSFKHIHPHFESSRCARARQKH